MSNLLQNLNHVDLKGKKTEINQVGALYVTKDYDKFSFLDGNRVLNERNLAKLEASMIEQQLIIPIICNERHQIIDGQHRFTVARRLSLPIYFLVNPGYGLNEVERANTSGVLWKTDDFLHKYVSQGNTIYCSFDDLLKKYKLNVIDLIKLFAFYQNQSEKHVTTQFTQGKFTDVGIEEVLVFLHSLEMFKFFEPYSKTRPFVRAFFRLFSHPRFSLERMEKGLENRKHMLVKRSTIDDYLYILSTEIYSYGQGKNLIHYDKLTKKFY